VIAAVDRRQIRKVLAILPSRIRSRHARDFITSFTKAWRVATREAGCPGRIPHDLRRTAVRNLVRAGIPERVAMRMTGHKTPSVWRYNIVSDGDLREAAQKLNLAAMGSVRP